jgi:hypothetical protein
VDESVSTTDEPGQISYAVVLVKSSHPKIDKFQVQIVYILHHTLEYSLSLGSTPVIPTKINLSERTLRSRQQFCNQLKPLIAHFNAWDSQLS